MVASPQSVTSLADFKICGAGQQQLKQLSPECGVGTAGAEPTEHLAEIDTAARTTEPVAEDAVLAALCFIVPLVLRTRATVTHTVL
jgi:hypothetical protein